MAPPTSYTEESFKEFLHDNLGDSKDLAQILGWTVAGGDYDEILNETLLAYGASDIAQVSGASNIRLLRAHGRVQLWRTVAGRTAGEKTNVGVANGSFSSPKTTHERALAMLKEAKEDLDSLMVAPVTKRASFYAY